MVITFTLYTYLPFADDIHFIGANYVKGAVMFPHNIGLAATWDPKIVYMGAKVTAKDTRLLLFHI